MKKYLIHIELCRHIDMPLFLEGESLEDPKLRHKLCETLGWIDAEMGYDIENDEWLTQLKEGVENQKITDFVGIKAYELASDAQLVPFIWHDVKKYFDKCNEESKARKEAEDKEFRRREYARLKEEFENE